MNCSSCSPNAAARKRSKAAKLNALVGDGSKAACTPFQFTNIGRSTSLSLSFFLSFVYPWAKRSGVARPPINQ